MSLRKNEYIHTHRDKNYSQYDGKHDTAHCNM